MDMREAKRIACHRAAQQVAGDIQADGIDGIDGLTERDSERVRAALRDLYKELMRRAGEEIPPLWESMFSDE